MAWKRAINIHAGKPKWGPTDFVCAAAAVNNHPSAAHSLPIIM